MILSKTFFFQNTKISDISPQIIHFKNLDDSVVIFQALQTSAASLTSVASVTSLASTASTVIFPQKLIFRLQIIRDGYIDIKSSILLLQWSRFDCRFSQFLRKGWEVVTFLRHCSCSRKLGKQSLNTGENFENVTLQI